MELTLTSLPPLKGASCPTTVAIQGLSDDWVPFIVGVREGQARHVDEGILTSFKRNGNTWTSSMFQIKELSGLSPGKTKDVILWIGICKIPDKDDVACTTFLYSRKLLIQAYQQPKDK